MKSISGKKLAKIWEKKGWILVKTKGSHFKYEKGQDSLIVPIHSNKDLPIGTLKSILKDANLTENDLLWFNLYSGKYISKYSASLIHNLKLFLLIKSLLFRANFGKSWVCKKS